MEIPYKPSEPQPDKQALDLVYWLQKQDVARATHDDAAFDAANAALTEMVGHPDAEQASVAATMPSPLNPRDALQLALNHQKSVARNDGPGGPEGAHSHGQAMQHANDQLLTALQDFKAEENPSHKH